MENLDSAAKDVKELCEAFLHFDEAALKKFRYSREDVYKMWTNSLFEMIKEIAQNVFSENQVKKIGDAMVAALRKVEVETEDLTVDKVAITIKGLNIGSVFKDADWQFDVDSKAKKQEITDAFVRTLEKKFDALQPVQTLVFVTECGYYEDVKFCVPLDMQNFSSELFTAATGVR